MPALTSAVANRLWLAANTLSAARFHRALHRPENTQRGLLARYLRDNAATAFGTRHRFADIASAAQFQQRVPISTHDDYAPHIARIAAGEPNILTQTPVRYFALSSGSTRAEKWIPYTPALLAEFNRAIAPWIADLFRRRPHLMNGPAYWSVTPAALRAQMAASKIPVGFDDDSAYVGGALKRLVDRTLAVPAELRHVADMHCFRYLTLLCLLRQRDLRMISVWHPSFLSLLLEALPQHWERLLADIADGHCRPPPATFPPGRIPPEALRAVQHRARPDPARTAELSALGPHTPSNLWPQLGLISCWRDSHSRAAADTLAAQFPHTFLQAKGLIATEAFASLPLIAYPAPVVAIRSHFFEFLSDDRPAPVLAHATDINADYTLIVTTAGGFYRYNTGDRIRIVARAGQTPCFHFLGKQDHISDRRGEKLNALFVEHVLVQWQSTLQLSPPPPFTMLAPDGSGYTLFLQCDARLPSHGAAALDQLLSANPHYRHCRALEQLTALRLYRIRGDGHRLFMEACQRHGQRLGNIKPAALHARDDWAQHFPGEYLP